MRLNLFVFWVVMSMLVSLHLFADTTSGSVFLQPAKQIPITVPAQPSYDINYWCHKNVRDTSKVVYYPAHARMYKDKTIAFYTLYFLSLLLGIIPYTDPKYFTGVCFGVWLK